MKYRLYVDEVGNSDLGASRDPNHRYLSLTGVIMDYDYVAQVAAPALEDLKRRYFGGHPDEPLILHRKDLVNQRPPFHSLRDPELCTAFNEELLGLIEDLACVVITVVIDKLDHARRYKVWHQDPYHYCLTALVERYVNWLRVQQATGDAVAESRGKRDDMQLKKLYRHLCDHGTNFMPARRFAARLTSKELKVRPKQANLAGLQYADMIAHPSLTSTAARIAGNPIPENFGGQVAKILEASKYRRRADGWVWGYGRVWIPSSAQPRPATGSPPPAHDVPG